MPPERDGTRLFPAPVIPPQAAAVVAAGTAGDPAFPETDGHLGRRQAGIVTAANAAVSEHAVDGGAHDALPGVLADVPVAVLVIDRRANAVTYANTAAVQLAGNVGLPVDVDTWGTAAGLTDLNGEPLASSSGPLSMVAQGLPVSGEAVRLATRAGGEGDGPAENPGEQVLWVTGFPLSQVDSEQQLALVVFLQLEGTSRTGDPGAYLKALRERAVLATDIAFTICDPREPDAPLVWVNPSFTRITGYEYDEAVGRNCRFLQGPASDPEAVATVRQAVQEQRTVTTTLLNYRKDGTAFWNQLSISPVFDGEGTLVSFVGVQSDVTERVRADSDRAAAFAAERAARQDAEQARSVAEQARAEAERAQRRLTFMSEVTSTLIATLDMPELLDQLARLCVPALADWTFITLVDEYGTVQQTAARHREGREAQLQEFATLHGVHLPDTSPSRRSLATSRPVLLSPLTPEILTSVLVHPGARAAFERLGGTSVLSVPMVARRRTLGALALVMASGTRSFSQEDVELAEDLARRAALVMDNVRLYQQEHTVADTLQRSLLPELPDIAGIESAAHYVSASVAADVGGDFYDLLDLPDGSIGMVVGDVVGHDVAAAAAMGHLRGIIRACVWDAEEPDPAAVLARVDRLVQGLRVASLATVVYLRALRPAAEGEPWRVQIANAGHPPLLLRHPDGGVELVDGVTGLLVGVDHSTHRTTLTRELPVGSTLIAYTDGLIERPGEDMDDSLQALAERLRDARVGAGPRELCDAAVDGNLNRRDDVAIIAVRFC